MIRLLLASLLLATPAWAQDDEDDEPPSQAAREAVIIVEPPPPPPPAPKPRRKPGRNVNQVAAVPGYMRMLGSDWLGTQLSISLGGEAPNGFAALFRMGAFLGASSFGVPVQQPTIAAVFVIPTGTRLRITLGHQMGAMILEEPHTTTGNAYTFSMGGFLEPTVDLVRRDTRRLYLAGRIGYDWIVARRGDENIVSVGVGLGYSF